MRCPNPLCDGGYLRMPILDAERGSVDALMIAMGCNLVVITKCPDCIGSIAHCCEGMTAANDE